jgi:hypothetical protein
VFYRDCSGVVVCFDLTALASFEHVEKWLNEVQRHQPEDAVIPVVLVGTKLDMAATRRQVSQAAALEFCKQHGVTYFETSAKAGQDAARPFDHLAQCCVKQLSDSGSGGDAKAGGGAGATATASAAPPAVQDRRFSSRLESPKHGLMDVHGRKAAATHMSSFVGDNDGVRLDDRLHNGDSGGCCS